MKYTLSLLFFISIFLSSFAQDWGTSFSTAISTAKKEHKFILLSFSGSDWCGPCIKLHKEVFTTTDFIKLAGEKMVLLNADFPRYKKNQLSKEQQKSNDDLAEKYNYKGAFPLTVLLDENGKMLKNWEGFPASIPDFIEDIQRTVQP